MARTLSTSIEPLEARVAPAGIVTIDYDAAVGALTITGDALGNEFEILAIGPNAHRIQALGTTTLAGGLTALEVGKVKSLTINAGAGADTVVVTDLLGLTSFSFQGGAGADTFTAYDFKVKGAASFADGDGADTVSFDGNFALVTGNLTFTNTSGEYTVSFDTPKTSIGGSLSVIGGGDPLSLGVHGYGTAFFGKGILLDATAAVSSSLVFSGTLRATVGKLPTGESIRHIGGSGETFVAFEMGPLTLLGGVSVSSGNEVDLRFVSGDRMSVGKLATGESILLQAGGGFRALAIETRSFTAAGGIGISGASGQQQVTIDVPQGKLTIGKAAGGASIDIAGTSGDDTIVLEAASATLAGGIRFDSTGGGDSLELLSPNGTFRVGKLANGESINYSGGSGNDALAFLNANLVLSGGVFFEAKEGDNTFNLRTSGGSATIGKLGNGASLVFSGGAGHDRVTSNYAELTLAGGVDLNMRGGINVAHFRDYSLLRIGVLPNSQQSIDYRGGAGENYLDVSGASAMLKAAIGFEASGSFSSVGLVGNTRIGAGLEGVALRFKGGTGEDRMFFAGSVQLGAGLLFDGNTGDDRLEAEDLDFFSALGPVVFNANGGDDVFDLAVETIRLAGGLTFAGSTGTDTFALTANGVIGGAVSVDLGTATAGDQSAIFTSRHNRQLGLALNSSLDVIAAGASGTTDALTLTNVRLGGAAQIAFGEATSTITIDNLVAANILQIVTGGGADQVLIERNDFSGNSVFRGLATILMGAGSDNLRIGSASPLPNGGAADSTRARFLAGLTVDGADGLDTRNDLVAENDFPGGAPTGLATFEFTLF